MISVTPFQLDCLAHATQRAADFTNIVQDAVVGFAVFNPDAALDALTEAVSGVVAGFDECPDPDAYTRPQVVWDRPLVRALAGQPANGDRMPVGAA